MKTNNENNFIKIDIKNLIDWKEPNGEGCMASDKITKEGFKVGYMYREQPSEGKPDSGWRFMAGNEDEEYMENPDNFHDTTNSSTDRVSNLCMLRYYQLSADFLSHQWKPHSDWSTYPDNRQCWRYPARKQSIF